jgi:hypothetical protein
MRGWIGVDLDATLAHYTGWTGDERHIGEPIPLMAERVRRWLKDGIEVRIFTARVNPTVPPRDITTVTSAIQDYTEKHFGTRLKVTCQKDYAMVALWDDRCIQVEPNTGRRMDGEI